MCFECNNKVYFLLSIELYQQSLVRPFCVYKPSINRKEIHTDHGRVLVRIVNVCVFQ